MSFQHAVEHTDGLHDAFHQGLQALSEADKQRILCANPRKLTGSVNLDAAFAEAQPNASRWDYGIGIKKQRADEGVVWVEVHPASSHHIQNVLDKLAWLKTWLTEDAPLLAELPREFVWVASGKVSLQPGSPQRRKLAKAGIMFAGRKLKL